MAVGLTVSGVWYSRDGGCLCGAQNLSAENLSPVQLNSAAGAPWLHVSSHSTLPPSPEASAVPTGIGGGGAREQPFGKHSLAAMPSCVGGGHGKRREWGVWSSRTHKTPAVGRNLSCRVKSTSLSLLFYFIFGILVPQPGLEPVPPALRARSLSHWTAREAPPRFSLFKVCRNCDYLSSRHPPTPHTWLTLSLFPTKLIWIHIPSLNVLLMALTSFN